ncbi:class I SAM-dependent methyltransferase [bacterium]|nr:class I SAM-dependent methyltransferase [bacterium]MBU1650818.1 class I SAM-dependent methyltransferase [bacterium]
MYIPPKHHIPVLEDPIAYYYIPIFRSFFIKRLTMCMDLLPTGKIDKLLDIGCGTGIILPELIKRTGAELWACDIFLQEYSLHKMMELEGISAHLQEANILDLPYEDNFFDAVLMISVLEHVEDLNRAADEVIRVTKPGGTIVAGFPTKNAITDKLLGGSTGFHVSTHRQILASLENKLTSFKVSALPGFVPVDFSLYTACSGVKTE